MVYLRTKARSMKLQTMLLLIAAAWLAAVPSRGLSQDFGPIPSGEFTAWQNGSIISDLTVNNPYLAYPAEDISCDDGYCGCCSRCLKHRAVFGSAEYLIWWAKGTPLPPLVTTSPPGTGGGELDDPDTVVLFGNELGGEDAQSGGRATFGKWIDADHNVAAAMRFYGTLGDQDSFFIESTGDPLLSRPFFNVLTGLQDVFPIAEPGVTEGNITVDYRNHNFMGAEAYLQFMMHRECRRRVDLLVGYHFLRMDDALTINSFNTITEIGGPLPQGTTFDLTDRFLTQNEFHGGEFGFKGKMARGAWSFDGLVKVSLGSQRQQIATVGEGEIFIPPGPAAPLNGGLLALPTNIGQFERNRFVWIPEASLNLTYHHSPCVNFHVGYNIIWLSEAVTAGDQIDLSLNLSQQGGVLVGPPRPAVLFRERDYWFQGINLGVSCDF